MPSPHDSWATYYDFVYEQHFGGLYDTLTRRALDAIMSRCSGASKVVDFGAGTGRLAIPLAKAGRDVTAVDASEPMLRVLDERAMRAGVKVTPRAMRIDETTFAPEFDLALCIFTVLGYVTTDSSLDATIAAMARSLKPGGGIIFDVSPRAFFVGQSFTRPGLLERTVDVRPLAGDVYEYHERTRCRIDGTWHEYEDRFEIRYWPPEVVHDLMAKHGLRAPRSLAGEGLPGYFHAVKLTCLGFLSHLE